jgi:thiosulfate/3-mercaptopyruvate sulfurtransferase
MNIFTPLIEIDELRSLLNDSNLIIIDASNSVDSKNNYQKNHISGALFVDLNSQLSNIKLDVSIGGRHPLPSTKQFSKVLYDIGISINSHVVVYDNSYASNAAARFWWMLRAAGIYNVQVLNGGFQVAIKHKFPTSSMVEIPKKAESIIYKHWLLPIVDIDEVEIATESSSQIIIDVRDKERFI